VAGDGNAFRFELAATNRPACDISWAGATSDPNSYYHLALFTDPGLTTPALDKTTQQPIQSIGLSALPDPHASMGPGAISSPGPYYVAVRRVGNPPTTNLTVFCRMDMSATARVTASSSPTPGDAAGAFSVGAFDATKLTPESYSSEGPTDDGRLKPDIAAPTNVLITPGDPESDEVNACGGTSCATPHVGGAAALIWGEVAAAGGAGSVAQRVRDRLVAQALDVGTPGPDTFFGAGRLASRPGRSRAGRAHPRSQLARAWHRAALASAQRGRNARDAGAHGRRPALVATLAPGGVLQATWPTAGLAAGPHLLSLVSSDLSGNVAHLLDHAPRRQPASEAAPALAPARPRAHEGAGLGLRARHRQRSGGQAADQVPGTAARAADSVSDTATSARGATSVSILATDRAGNSTLVPSRPSASAPRL